VTFEAIFESELPYVWHALRRLGVPERDREDLVHDVFLIVHRRLAEYDRLRPLRPWLFGIAYRRAADYRRLSRHRREVFVETSEPADAGPSAEDSVAAGEARALLGEALDLIDYDRRAVVILHDLEDVPVPEIARALSIPLRTAYSRLRVGREELTAATKRLALRKARP
jgi:RNA polymerase sigma-70 factor (ECF subfamily)